MRSLLKRLAVVAVAALSIGAGEAPADAPIQDWSTNGPEVVVVTPDKPGPALWHIVKGDSEVWILPTVSPVPKDLAWDSSAIADLLKGAKGLLLPPRATVGIFEGMWFWMTSMDVLEQPDDKRLEDTLPADLRARFVAARQRIGKDEDRYGKYLGGVAALMLENDTFKAMNLSVNGPQKTIEGLASRASVRAHPTATYKAMDVIDDVPKMSAASHIACLQYALSDIDMATAHAGLAARAWAVADISGVKAHALETKLEDCLNQNAAFRTLREHANRDMTNAILTVLQKPGKTIAVMPMSFFLRKGGVLDRLEAAGLTVSGPGS